MTAAYLVAVGGWIAGLVSSLLLLLQRDRARAQRNAFQVQAHRLAGEIAALAAATKEQVTRLERANEELNAQVESAMSAIEGLASEHPAIASDLLVRVFRDAQAATSTGAQPAVPGRPAAKVPGSGS